ncbi:winged helix-turn-helix transcriptional regulator [Streptomyces chartreusis]|uniref:winged helix-turn-helix transcriptional regulator n=1 Tax=Streptomyces chartreusis TaxID=1969 RepID=UPI0036A82E48
MRKQHRGAIVERGRFDVNACQKVDDSIIRVFTLLGKRWTGLILYVLLQQAVRFAELHRAVPGISARMLSARLTELGMAGLVFRDVDEGPPLRVSYRLTKAGAALEPALKELEAWAEQHLPRSGSSRGRTSADS